MSQLYTQVMELTTKEYMELLLRREQELFKLWLQMLHYSDCTTGATVPTVQSEQLTALLVRQPYPTLQILKHCNEQSKKHISRVVTDALQVLLSQNVTDYTPQFINFLTHLPLSILDAPALRAKLIQRLTTPISTPHSDDAYLALLARTESNLLVEVLEKLQKQWQRCVNGSPSKEFVLLHALRQKQHFVPHCAINLKDVRGLADVGLRNNLLILKIANEFANPTQTLAEMGNINKWLDEFIVAQSPAHLQEVHKYFYADLRRIITIFDFLKKYAEIFKGITVEALLNASSIMKLLFDHDINASFEDTRRIIESIHKWQLQMSHTKSIHELEVETLHYYAALSTVYDVVLADTSLSLEDYYTSKMQHLNAMLRKMLNIDMLCTLIEDIFQLIFLRWEHLRSDSAKRFATFHANRSRSMRSSSTSSTDDAAAETPTPTTTLNSTARTSITRHGFICRGRALQAIFTFLKGFVTKKLHSEDYKLASEHIQLRFQRIIDVIGEALWKYSVLEKIDNSLAHAGTQQRYLLEAEELLQLVRVHTELVEKSSSDDDSHDRCNYTSLTRRKAARKKRRATFSGAAAGGITRPMQQALEQSRARAASIMTSSMGAVQDMTECEAKLKARKIMNRFTDRSIMSQMLGSPENLAIMALALKNFNDVKFIIENFNLQNTELNRELAFAEQQQQVKQKLATIYANYQQQEQKSLDTGQPKATVEQIKTVAAKGFEVSRIISVIDTFAKSQRIVPNVAEQQLLQKHSSNPQYPFLCHFQERKLNAILVTDLVLNMPLNREIATNLLMVIRRQQELVGGIDVDDIDIPALTAVTNAKSQLPKDMGAMPLLENLSECLRLQERRTLRELLSDNYYSLKPCKLAHELQRERAFNAVFYKTPSEIGRIEELRAHATLFQELQSKCNYYQRFNFYVQQLAQLLQLRDRNLEYHTSALLKIDACDVIGELIFECGMTPLEIEANVSALNLNLVHVIALNVCPEIAGKCSKIRVRPVVAPLKAENTLGYVAHQHQLLAYLLQGVLDVQCANMSYKNLNVAFIQRFIELIEVNMLAALFGDNKFVAALRSDCIDMKLLAQLDCKLTKLDVLKYNLSNQVSKQLLHNHVDNLVVQLIATDAKHISLASDIHDIALRAKLIYENFTKIATTRLAKQLIENTLQHKEAITRVPAQLRQQLEDTLADITIYAKVSEVLQFETWPQAYDFGMKTPNAIFEKLLQSHLYKLCYNWCKVVQLSTRFAPQKTNFLAILLNALLELHDNSDVDGDSAQSGSEVNTYLLQILETFPLDDCVTFLDTNKDKFRSVLLLRYAIDFLTQNNLCSESYRNYKISLVIFEQLTPDERAQFWKLLKYPLLIIEQLIMNAKFEILTKVLSAVRSALQQTDAHDSQVCAFCFDKRGHIYDIHTRGSPHKVQFQLGAATSNATTSAFILLNFNLYQKNHLISNDCIDLLLRIYGTKALDYHVSDTASSSERISQTTDMQQSLDSLCGAFQMPNVAPTREDWVHDDEATHCMCCRRAAFTMLMRRHHCRRCGRVVCFACSAHRMRIPDLYADVEVRICNDCFSKIEETQQKLQRASATNVDSNAQMKVRSASARDNETYKWKLSGNITHDKLVREEFCYEHAPSVALCLSILSYHLGQQKCVDLLLYHCQKLEKLIVPNPEVDYELVAKMMNCLALAAKVRGGPAEVETIREHSEIIMSIVQNGCESLIPPGPLNNHSLRKLGDSLVQAEKWHLALEVHLKCGFPTAGVMAAHGLSCLRAGCFDTAREKFSHCMPKLSSELLNTTTFKCIMTPPSDDCNANPAEWCRELDIPHTKRPQRGPPLLQEILKIIETAPCTKPQPETLQRASIIRNSNTSLASLLSRRKDPCPVRIHEPALNVLTTLANLKHIAKGQYGDAQPISNTNLTNKTGQPTQHTRNFEECIYYVLTYGSHADILRFLVRHHELIPTLKYFLLQTLEADLFIQHIFLVALRRGEVTTLISSLQAIDAKLLIWRPTLLQTCRYLETHNLLNSLYQLQVLLHDTVRASMTCVRFYSANCESFQQLHANALHLHNAQKHLQSELEETQWENINVEPLMRQRNSSVSSRRSIGTGTSTPVPGANFLMQLDARSLNGHLNTISMQLDVAKFLAQCEKENNAADEPMTLKILKQIRVEPTNTTNKMLLPTLFDTTPDKIQICILILLCGKNIEEGFGLAFRIIHHYKLSEMKVFGATAKFLACNQRLTEVEKLLNCITSNNGTSTRDIDEILSIAINAATNSHEPDVKTTLDNLAKKIHSVETRIACHIFIGQLKSAYLLANKHERLADIRKILRQAELTNQVHIKKLCEKKLNINVSRDQL